MKPETLLKTAKKKGLNGIAVTDHFSIEGALKVKRLNKDENFDIIIGEEISTKQGDVIAYYIQNPIYSTDFFKVVEEIKKQNGLVIIPHPFRTSLNPQHKFKLPFKQIKGYIDAVECFNARMLFNADNKKAEDVANKYDIAKTAGSDAHFRFEIANAYTLFEEDLRKALKERITRLYGNTGYGAFGGLLSFLRVKVCVSKPQKSL